MSKVFWGLIIFAFALRMVWVFAAAPAMGFGVYEYIDGDGYLSFASAFHRGEYFTDPELVLRVPFYPALIAFVTLLPLEPLNLLRVWHILLDLVTLGGIFLFAHRTAGSKAAVCSAALYAIYPLAIYRLAMMNTEIIQAAALTLWGLGAYQFARTGRERDALCLAILTAAMLYLNPATQLIPLVFSLFLFWRAPQWRTVRLLAVFLLPVVLVCIAWGTRNYVLTGDFFLFDVRGGKEFWLGNHPGYDGRWEGPMKEQWMRELWGYQAEIREQGGTEHDFNSAMFQKGWHQIKEDPLGALWLDAKKLVRFWFVPASERMMKITYPVQGFYLLLAGCGIWALGVRDRAVGMPLFLVTYLCFIYTLSYACIRFSHPIMPWVCVLAGAGVIWIMDGWKGRET